MNRTLPFFALCFLGACCFTVATVLQPDAMVWSQSGQGSVLKILLGNGRQLLANHFMTKADVYFHSGYYPTIFDKKPAHEENHLAGGDADHHESAPSNGAHENHDEHGDEHEADFMGPPRDLFERIGRHALITEHTHLEHGNEREILPWLKLTAELDPHKTEAYTIASYWLANRLGKQKEAEQFLREGLRQNPDSYEILLELGKLYWKFDHDSEHAANVWKMSLRRWLQQEPQKQKPNYGALYDLTLALARYEEQRGDYHSAIAYLEQARTVSPSPEALDKQIADLRKR
jgi:tetratricopeptide (TPR) repeat protein